VYESRLHCMDTNSRIDATCSKYSIAHAMGMQERILMLTAFVVLALYSLQWYVSYKIMIDTMRFKRDVDRSDVWFAQLFSLIPVMFLVSSLLWLMERSDSHRANEIVYKRKEF
jgi:hypothetical protein